MCKFADIFATETGHFGHFNSADFRPTCHPEFILFTPQGLARI